ncbi:sensor histidine kinase [Microscilla marina]|uniref:histidine kinase n=1 Tax=Microscilla marina ATCC 23134 TaxID=313606 RepID=A1ZSI2_MICM2|nr:sensor histidine kinase [Microscilla marina]EAY26730.1 lipoprotein, putative [Microscilla marina ATCC 23134]
MTTQTKLWWVCFLGCLLWLTGCSPVKTKPKVTNGKMDLSQYDFAKSGTVLLSGDWEFYWEKFYYSSHFKKGRPTSSKLVNVPESWNGLNVGGKTLAGNGYATYRMRLTLPAKGMKLGVKMLTVATAYELYINGKLLCTNGKISRQKQGAVPSYNPLVVNFVNDTQEVEIIWLVSNYHHRKGGAWQEVRVGLEHQIDRNREATALADFFLMGSIFIMALYHIGLFWARRKSVSALYFSGVCLMAALRLTVTDEYFLHDFVLVDWFTIIRLEYLSMNLGMPATAWLLRTLYPQEYPKRLAQAQSVMFLFLSLIVLFLPPHLFTQTVTLSQLGIVISGFYAAYLLVKAALRKREGALLFIVGFLAFFGAIVNDILYSNDVIETDNVFGTGLFIFIFSQALLLSRRFSKAFSEAEQLTEALNFTNQNLEELVGVRTQDLKDSNNKLNQSLEELDAINEKLIELDKFKQQMMGMIVHDLKNPLNSIIGLSEQQNDPRFFSTIHQSGQRMQGLIMDILDVQKFEESKMKLLKDKVVLEELLQWAIQQISFLIREKNHQVTIEAPSDVYVEVDKDLLLRVMVNLLTNASKHTPQNGKICLSVETTANEQGKWGKVLVADSGEGIPATHIDKIFKKFHQVSPKKSGAIRSTGLGLTFCKLTVEAHGGHIGVVSPVGEGATFWFTLPLAAPPTTQTLSAGAPSVETSQRPIAFDFTSEELALLKPVAVKVAQYEIFQISKIREAMAPLDTHLGESLKNWRIELEDSMYTYNEQRFKELLEML